MNQNQEEESIKTFFYKLNIVVVESNSAGDMKNKRKTLLKQLNSSNVEFKFDEENLKQFLN